MGNGYANPTNHVNEVLDDREKFVKNLATSLRYQLCLIPESFQISMMNTTQQFLIVDRKREMEFQTHKRRHGGSRWMFKTYDTSLSSWLFDLTTVDSKDNIIDEPAFTYVQALPLSCRFFNTQIHL